MILIINSVPISAKATTQLLVRVLIHSQNQAFYWKFLHLKFFNRRMSMKHRTSIICTVPPLPIFFSNISFFSSFPFARMLLNYLSSTHFSQHFLIRLPVSLSSFIFPFVRVFELQSQWRRTLTHPSWPIPAVLCLTMSPRDTG